MLEPANLFYPVTLDDVIEELTQPFEIPEIKWRLDSIVKTGHRVVPYLDARTIFDRLNSVVPSGWNFQVVNAEMQEFPHPDDRNRLLGVGWKVHSRLTILGVTREDVGTSFVSTRRKGEDTADKDYTDSYLREGAQLDAKTAVSDSVKRVAAQFGIGMYLWKYDYVTVIKTEDKYPDYGTLVPQQHPKAIKRLMELGQTYHVKGKGRTATYETVLYILDQIKNGSADALDKTIAFLEKNKGKGIEALHAKMVKERTQ